MASSPEHLRLLTAVCPTFLRLATFYISDDETARAARAQLDDKEPFYASLHIELQILSETLCHWDQRVAVPKSHLERALEVLESRFVMRSKKRFGNLEDLRRRLDDPRDNDPIFTINGLRNTIQLRHSRKGDRRHMINRFSQCNEELGRLKHRHTPQKLNSRPKPKEELKTGISRLPTSKVREHANLFHRLLSSHWRCKCHASHTAAKLLLATNCSLEEVRFDMLFCAKSELPGTWQEAEIRAVLTETPRFMTDHARNAPPRRPAGVKCVSFALNESPLAAPFPISQEERWQVEGVCPLIQTAANLTSRRLQLLVDNNILWHSTTTLVTNGIRRANAVSLGDLMRRESCFKLPKRRSRYILAVILANALLELYEGPWLIRDWNKSHICFYPDQNPTELDLTRPYLSTQCTSPQQIKEDQEAARFRIHPYPSILALGILLLELELGKSIEAKRSQDNPNSGQGFRNIDADRPVAMQMLEECEGESPEDFIEAIKACLYDQTFTDDFGRNADFENLQFRQQIYARIVKPLEDGLEKTFRISVEELDRLSSTPGRIASMSIAPEITHPQLSPYSTKSPRRYTAVAAMATSAKHPEHEPSQSQRQNHVSLFYDDSADIGIAERPQLRMADDWFQFLRLDVHPLVKTGQTDNIKSPLPGIFPSSGAIRIAILDTGISFPEEAEDIGYTDRIIETKSWLGGSANTDPELERGDLDLDGHGTHAAALLLHVAPDADIYVARVCEGKRELKGRIMADVFHKRVADAIRHATDTWKVDIISMSFGFEQSVVIIDEAIKHANSQKVIMLAAASNKGGNGVTTWPARLPEVMSIYATDGLGNRCTFTPNPSSNADNFSILGHAVKSFWPPCLKQGAEVHKSGTSTATPIAAGIAALVLQYMRYVLSERAQIPQADAEMFCKLRTTAGMSTVFRRMAPTKRDGYDYIVPWNFMSKAKPREASTVYDIVLGDLRDHT